uniref:Uncharacterized protein n=1 Tax=Arundo donax TaxID=35708 RepID=A0A0A8Z0R9_ARUDO
MHTSTVTSTARLAAAPTRNPMRRPSSPIRALNPSATPTGSATT